MSQRDDKTIAFRPRSGASPEPGRDADEPVYEVDDVAVESDGTVRHRRGDHHGSRERLPEPGRTRGVRPPRAPASKAGTPTPLAGRAAPAPGATGDLHRARDAARDAARGRDARRPRHGAGGRRGAPATGGRAEAAERGRGERGRAARDTAPHRPDAGGRRLASLVGAVACRVPRRKAKGPSSAADAQGARRRPLPSRRALAVAAVVLVCALFLYGPSRDLYMARRNQEILQAQLDELEAENALVEKKAQALTTEQGIEDEARLHGYVKEGEETATVSGLPDDQKGEAVPIPEDVRESVLAREDPWYVQALDRFFLYEKGSQDHE